MHRSILLGSIAIYMTTACCNSMSSSSQAAHCIERSSCPLEEIDSLVEKALETFHVPGVAVGVVVDDQVLLSRGYGARNLSEGLPVTERTLFAIGSCTKAFTALLLSQLAEEGKVALDDPVIKYIPEFSLLNREVAEQLTLRDLLAHRTGMARHDPLWIFLEVSQTKVVELLKHLEPACGPRQEFVYNNLMYALAGIVIERVTGQTWEETVSSRIFNPLGMQASNASIEQLQRSADFSMPHAEIEGTIKTLPFRNLFSAGPAGGINSSVLDLTQWVRFHMSNAQGQALQEMHSMQMPFSTPAVENEELMRLGYGLGWFLGKYRGRDLVSHSGDVDGFSSEVFFLPNEKIGLVILTNSSSDGRLVISYLRNQIIDKFLGVSSSDWLKKAQETRDLSKCSLQDALRHFLEQGKTFQTCFSDYVGCYEHPAYGAMELKIENGQLLASYNNNTSPLYFKSEDVFTGQFSYLMIFGINPLVDFTFTRNAAGEIEARQVPFEGFRGAKPITFTSKSQQLK